MTAAADPAPPVRKRLVFYFGGFDPRGPAHYHSLYEHEAKIQAAINGLDLEIGKRGRSGKLASTWSITSADGTVTQYEYLRWDDIIRSLWPKNEWQLLKAALPVYAVFAKENLIGRLWKIAWSAALTVGYPIIALLGTLLLGFGVAFVLALLPWILGGWWWLGAAPGLTALAGTIGLCRWLDHKFRSYWLLRTYCLMQPWSYGKVPELDVRIKEFATHIAEAISTSDADEALVVGHSVGSILTISLVAEILKHHPNLGLHGPKLGLVSLGNCIPLVSILSGSQRLRDDMLTVATAPGVHWVDFSARRDGASLTQIDPLKVSGIERPDGIPIRPLQFPVRIFKMFPPEVYDVIKRDIFRIHFQYIMAAQLPTAYDFFAITAGSQFLAARFPAQSRVGQVDG